MLCSVGYMNVVTGILVETDDNNNDVHTQHVEMIM